MVKTISFDKAVDILETAEVILCDDERVIYKQWEPEQDGEPEDVGGTYAMEWGNDGVPRKFRAMDNEKVQVVPAGAYHALVLTDRYGYRLSFMPLQGIVIKEAL